MRIDHALAQSGIDPLDAEVLLAALLCQDRAWLLTHMRDELASDQLQTWYAWVARRRAHEPIAYIIGQREFCRRPFVVDRRVLIPRPATEELVAVALQYLKDPKDNVTEIDAGIVAVSRVLRKKKPTTVVDIGTGSGCIAITLACETDVKIIATDNDAHALHLAKINAEKHGVAGHIDFRQGDGLDPVAKLRSPFLIVSNPPYIPDGTQLMRDVHDYEPHGALFAGPDGLDVIRRIVGEAKENTHCVGFVLECRADQAETVSKI